MAHGIHGTHGKAEAEVVFLFPLIFLFRQAIDIGRGSGGARVAGREKDSEKEERERFSGRDFLIPGWTRMGSAEQWGS